MEKILTGKFRKDFFKYRFKNIKHTLEDEEMFFQDPPQETTPYIMDFIDSLGLWEDSFYFEYRKTMFKDFKRALTATLITVSKNYNNGVNRKM